MGQRGPKPASQGKRPKPITGEMTPPCHLDPDAREVWLEVVSHLEQLGALSCSDADTIEQYAIVCSRWRHAEEMLVIEGLTVELPNGMTVRSPYLAIADKALQHLRFLSRELGLTPASRSRLTVNETEKDAAENRWGDLVG